MEVFKYAINTKKIQPVINTMLDEIQSAGLTMNELEACLTVIRNAAEKRSPVVVETLELTCRGGKLAWTLSEKFSDRDINNT